MIPGGFVFVRSRVMAYKLSKKLRLGLEKLDDGTKTPWTTIRDNGELFSFL